MNSTADDRVDMQRSTGESMEGYGRNFRAFWSSRLKNNQLSLARFSDLDRTESGRRLDRLAEVRSREVAKGKALVANPHYPDEATVLRMSRLLAEKLGSSC
jgi:hypothetical protein